MERVFESFTREKAEGRTRLLICDGHGSHITAKFVAHCIEHDIRLFQLLPHSSHLLQPLDVGVFGPLKKAISSQLDRLIRVGVPRLEKAEWMENYVKARETAFTKSNILGGWRGAGLFPLNRYRPTHDLPELPVTSSANNSIVPTFEDLFAESLTLDATTVCKLIKKLAELAIKDEIDTSARLAIPRIANAVEEVLTENVILKRQLTYIKEVLRARQERKTGKRSILKGRNPVSTPEIPEELKNCEENTKSRKKKGGSKMKKKQEDIIQRLESESEDDDESIEAELLG